MQSCKTFKLYCWRGSWVVSTATGFTHSSNKGNCSLALVALRMLCVATAPTDRTVCQPAAVHHPDLKPTQQTRLGNLTCSRKCPVQSSQLVWMRVDYWWGLLISWCSTGYEVTNIVLLPLLQHVECLSSRAIDRYIRCSVVLCLYPSVFKTFVNRHSSLQQVYSLLLLLPYLSLLLLILTLSLPTHTFWDQSPSQR